MTVARNPKLVANRPTESGVQDALLSAPAFLASIGITPADVEKLGEPNGPLPLIGQGYYAAVYALPGGQSVLKVTDDEDDADAADMVRRRNLAGEYPRGVLSVSAVKKLPHMVKENETSGKYSPHFVYAIVSEAVRPLAAYIYTVIDDMDRIAARAGAPLLGSVSSTLSFASRMGIRSLEELVETARERAPLGSRDTETEVISYVDKATRLIVDAPDLMELFDEVLQGAYWMAGHGFRVFDLHPGNFGQADNGRTVLFDFGHGSRLEGVASQVEMASNGRMTPNARNASLAKARRVFDECFNKVEAKFPDFGELELHEDDVAGSDNGSGSERQFGYCKDGDPIVIAFARKIEKLPLANIRGLMAHEFGHAIDFRYGKKLTPMLGVRLPAGIERRADTIAKAVFGQAIEYDEKLIQCIACGGQSPRPRKLGA
jgi:hypothetical protein